MVSSHELRKMDVYTRNDVLFRSKKGVVDPTKVGVDLYQASTDLSIAETMSDLSDPTAQIIAKSSAFRICRDLDMLSQLSGVIEETADIVNVILDGAEIILHNSSV